MIGRAKVVALATMAAAALFAVAGSAPASLWPPQTVKLTITRGDHVMPGNVAVWPGEQIVLEVTNYTHGFHTFTVPALGLSALILPAKGTTPYVTTVHFKAQAHGVVSWLCVICPSGMHGDAHAMNGKIYSMVR